MSQIGSERTGQDFFTRTEVQLRDGIGRGAHLPWPARMARRARLLTGRSRVLAVVVVGLLIAAPALAASGVIRVGSTVPRAGRQSATSGNGLALRGAIKVTSLRVPNPTGGPPWGLRVTNTTRGTLCPVAGRVVDGRIGAIGIDGAFHNDGNFHPYAADYPNYTFDGMSCAPVDANGHGFVYDTWFAAPTSAALQNYCLPRWPLPPALRRMFRRMHRPLPKPTLPACPKGESVDIYFGLLGPDVTKIAYRGVAGHLYVEQVGIDGAYLAVIPHQLHNEPSTGSSPGIGGGAIVGVSLRAGRSCGVLGRQRPERALYLCVGHGYSAPAVPVPSEAAVRSPLTVRRLAGKSGQWTVSFKARVAVHNARSYYASGVSYPPHVDPGTTSPQFYCQGLLGDSLRANVRAGQRLTLGAGESGPCFGVARGIVEYVVVHRALDDRPHFIPPSLISSAAARRRITIRIVGRFSYRVLRKRVRVQARLRNQVGT